MDADSGDSDEGGEGILSRARAVGSWLEKPIRWLEDADRTAGAPKRRWPIWVALVVAVAAGAATFAVGGRVLPMELAGSAKVFDSAKETLESAGKSPWWGTILDFGFIVAYVVAAGGFALRTGRRIGTEGWRRAGEWFMRAALVAGLLDVVENVFMLVMLGRKAVDWQTTVATGAAGLKFVLLLGGTVPFVFLAWARSWSAPPKDVRRYPVIGFVLIAWLIGFSAIGQLGRQLEGMRPDGRPSTSIGELTRSSPSGQHALLSVWNEWEATVVPGGDAEATTDTEAERDAVAAEPSEPFATVASVLGWRLGVEAIVVVPAYAVLIAFALAWLAERARRFENVLRWLRRSIPVLVSLNLLELLCTWIVFRRGPGVTSVSSWVLPVFAWAWLVLLATMVAFYVGVAAVHYKVIRPHVLPAKESTKGDDENDDKESTGYWLPTARGLKALRFEILVVVVLAVVLLDIIRGGGVDQLPDVIRGWDVRAAVAALFMAVALAFALRLSAHAVRKATLGKEAVAVRPEPNVTLRIAVATTFIVLGVGQLALHILGPRLTGRGLLIPAIMVGVFIAFEWVWRDRHDLVPERRDPGDGVNASRYYIAPWLPRLLGACVVGVIGLAVVRSSVPAVAYTASSATWLLGVVGVFAVLVVVPFVGWLRQRNIGIALNPWMALPLAAAPLAILFFANMRGPELSPEFLLALGILTTYLALGLYYFFDERYNLVGSREPLAAPVDDGKRKPEEGILGLAPVRGTGDGTDPNRTPRLISYTIAFASLVFITAWVVSSPLTGASAVGTVALLLLFATWLATISWGASYFVERTNPPKLLVFLFRLERTPVFALFVAWLVVLNLAPGFFTLPDYHDVRIESAAALVSPSSGLDGVILSTTPGCSEWVADLAGLDKPPSGEVEFNLERDTPALGVNEITISHAFHRWKCANQVASDDIEESGGTAERKAVPLVIVSSWGGGIRAAAWAALTLDCVFESKEAPCAGGGVTSSSIFALSGVSGGSLGFLEYAAYQDEKARVTVLAAGEPEGPGDESRREAAAPQDWVEERMGGDFLSPVAGRLLFADLPLSLVGFVGEVDDRGDILERAWEAAWRDEVDDQSNGGGALEMGLFDSWLTTLNVPLVVANGTSYTDGCSFNGSVLNESVSVNGVDDCTSLLAFEDYDGENDDESVSSAFVATRDLADFLCEGSDVRLSTAALLSARFGYVSPSGRIEEQCPTGEPQVVYTIDGGYHEGSGTMTAFQVWEALEPLIAEHNATSQTVIVPFMIHIENGYSPIEPGEPAARPNEWLVPATGGATSRLVSNARARVALEFSRPLLLPDGSELEVKAGDEPIDNRYAFITTRAHPGIQAPLGWTLSHQAIDDLVNQLIVNQDEFAEIKSWLAGTLKVE